MIGRRGFITGLVALVAVSALWISFMLGRSDVKQNTIVVDIWNGQKPAGLSRSFFGECFEFRLCATEKRRKTWIPRAL